MVKKEEITPEFVKDEPWPMMHWHIQRTQLDRLIKIGALYKNESGEWEFSESLMRHIKTWILHEEIKNKEKEVKDLRKRVTTLDMQYSEGKASYKKWKSENQKLIDATSKLELMLTEERSLLEEEKRDLQGMIRNKDYFNSEYDK